MNEVESEREKGRERRCDRDKGGEEKKYGEERGRKGGREVGGREKKNLKVN